MLARPRADPQENADPGGVLVALALAAQARSDRARGTRAPGMIVGLGVDAIDITRVEQLFERHPKRAVAKLFTPSETRYASARSVPARHFAARLAAKEAAYKALAGNDLARSIAWREIEVVTGDDGRPSLALHGKAAERAAQLQVARLWVTLTHADHSAVAVVILESA
jgi:holo-[acyl-carrier protein] synthase